MRIDKDRLNNASPKDVAQATYGLVDRLQDHPPHIQMAAAALLFLVVSKLWKAQPQDIFVAVGNLMSDPIHGERDEFRALRLYAKHELEK